MCEIVSMIFNAAKNRSRCSNPPQQFFTEIIFKTAKGKEKLIEASKKRHYCNYKAA